MSNVWKAFSKAELQEFVGPATLDRLHTILPALLGTNWNPDEILYKDNLVQIFEAFSGIKLLNSQSFRASFYAHLPKETLTELVGAPSNSGVSHTELAKRLAKRSWNDRKFAARVVEVLGLPDHLIPQESEKVPSASIVQPPDAPYKALKDYQFGVFLEAMEHLKTPNSRFIVQMPTGSGKTRTAMELVVNWLNQSPGAGPVIWLAHAVELCEQALAAFRELWSHVGTYEIAAYAVWGDNSELPLEPDRGAFVAGGFPKLHSLLQSGRLPEEVSAGVGLVVVDEAHKVLAPTYRAVVDAIRGPNTRVVGLTATPGRSAVNEDENRRLAQFFFQELVTINSGRESVIEYLRRREILSEVVRLPLETHQTYELSSADRAYLEKFYDLPSSFLVRLGSDDLRNVEIIRRLREHTDANRRILLFACSVEQSKFLVALLIFLGVKAAHVDGSTGEANRRFVIDQFRNGQIQVLSNYGVLSTGFDAPQTDVVFIARPTASIVLYSQIIGRGLRGPAIGGTAECIVVDVKDNIIGLPSQEAAYTYFDDYFGRESEE